MEQQFGEKEVCFRTLDLYTSAVLEASLNPTKQPKQEYRDAMALMSKVCGRIHHCLLAAGYIDRICGAVTLCESAWQQAKCRQSGPICSDCSY